VATNSGWFSDRSICYLASGKPVLAQDTGIRRLYPTGAGLVTFTTLPEASAAVEAIERDYHHHAKAARALAEECFDSDKVLRRLLSKLGLA
jgi:glycosyltransferase involved in cell wall biosynthesis